MPGPQQEGAAVVHEARAIDVKQLLFAVMLGLAGHSLTRMYHVNPHVYDGGATIGMMALFALYNYWNKPEAEDGTHTFFKSAVSAFAFSTAFTLDPVHLYERP